MYQYTDPTGVQPMQRVAMIHAYTNYILSRPPEMLTRQEVSLSDTIHLLHA